MTTAVTQLEQPMSDFIAYRDGDSTTQAHDPAKGFRFLSNQPYDFLAKSIGCWAWTIVHRRAHYHLTAMFMVSDVEQKMEGVCEIIGAGVPFEPPFDLTPLAWFPGWLHKRDHFSSDFEQIDGLDMVPFWRLLAERERETGMPLAMAYANLAPQPESWWKFPLSMMIYCDGCGQHFDIVVNGKEPENHRCPACGTVHTFGLEGLVQKAIEQSMKMAGKKGGRL